jgi:hypothetical protein
MSFEVSRDESLLYAVADGDNNRGLIMYTIDKEWVKVSEFGDTNSEVEIRVT